VGTQCPARLGPSLPRFQPRQFLEHAQTAPAASSVFLRGARLRAAERAEAPGLARTCSQVSLRGFIEPFQLPLSNVAVERYHLDSEQVAHLLAGPIKVP